MRQDRQAKRQRVDILAIGSPRVDGAPSAVQQIAPERALYLEIPAVSDDTGRGRLVDVSAMVDARWIGQLVSAAKIAGWTGRAHPRQEHGGAPRARPRSVRAA